MTPQDIIKQLPYEIAARMCGDEYFCDIPVTVFEEGSVTAIMQAKQSVITQKTGKRGVGVLVQQVVIEDSITDPQFSPPRYNFFILVVENVTLNNDPNGTGKAARQVGRRIRDIFKNTGIGGFTTAIACDDNFMIPIPLDREKFPENIKSYQCGFWTFEAAPQVALKQVGNVALTAVAPGTLNSAPPSIIVNLTGGTQIALSCPTVGAAIWFTLDNSYPLASVGNPPVPATLPNGKPSTAALYDDVITLPVGALNIIRAAAYLPGSIASNVLMAQIQT